MPGIALLHSMPLGAWSQYLIFIRINKEFPFKASARKNAQAAQPLMHYPQIPLSNLSDLAFPEPILAHLFYYLFQH